ncbi:hypothetical protein Bca4012_033939 [Brassica carinata]
MSMADPPGFALSPTRGSESREETQSYEHQSNRVLIVGVKDIEEGGDEEISELEKDKEGSIPKPEDLGVRGSKGDWVGAVQGQKFLKKYDVEITMKDGIGSVMVPEEITKGVPPLWEDFLIGKFLEDAPHIAKVHAIVNKIWNLNDRSQKIEVFEVNTTTMKFRIPNQVDRKRILRRGMWNLAGIPVILTKWSPVIEKEKPPVQSIPMWVHVKNVPIKMFSWQGLSFLTSPIGSPGRLHPETAQCLNLDVAKVFVKVDLTKDLPKKMNFNIQGEDVLVEYNYPWLPKKCEKCDKWGHSIKACLKGKDNQQEKHEEGEKKEVNHMEEKEEDEIVVEKVLEGILNEVNEEGKKESEAEDKDGEKLEVGEKTSPRRILQEEERVKEVEWLDVSPGKSSRSTNLSQRKLEFGQVSLLSKSRFAVLTPEEDKGIEEIENEEQGEDETHEVTKEEDAIPRRVLPRESKINHRYLKDKAGQKAQEADPGILNKKKNRRQ